MIVILPLKEEYLDYRVQLLNNRDVVEYLNVKETILLDKTIEWFRNRNTTRRFDCVFKNDSQIIGMGGLTNISQSDKNAELYMYIDPVFQGQGLGKKSLIELCRFGFNELELSKIYLYTFSSNIKANRMYEKVGFVREGYLRKHTMKNNCLQDRYFYGLLVEEFHIL